MVKDARMVCTGAWIDAIHNSNRHTDTDTAWWRFRWILRWLACTSWLWCILWTRYGHCRIVVGYLACAVLIGSLVACQQWPDNPEIHDASVVFTVIHPGGMARAIVACPVPQNMPKPIDKPRKM